MKLSFCHGHKKIQMYKIQEQHCSTADTATVYAIRSPVSASGAPILIQLPVNMPGKPGEDVPKWLVPEPI